MLSVIVSQLTTSSSNDDSVYIESLPDKNPSGWYGLMCPSLIRCCVIQNSESAEAILS